MLSASLNSVSEFAETARPGARSRAPLPLITSGKGESGDLTLTSVAKRE